MDLSLAKIEYQYLSLLIGDMTRTARLNTANNKIQKLLSKGKTDNKELEEHLKIIRETAEIVQNPWDIIRNLRMGREKSLKKSQETAKRHQLEVNDLKKAHRKEIENIKKHHERGVRELQRNNEIVLEAFIGEQHKKEVEKIYYAVYMDPAVSINTSYNLNYAI